MSVDYDAVSGFGIEFTWSEASEFVERDIFTEEDWDDDAQECLNVAGIESGEIGSCYSGELTLYAMFKPKNVKDAATLQEKFIADMLVGGVEVKPEDIEFISGIRIW